MNEDDKIQLFEGQQIRYAWDSEKEKYFFSVIDVIKVLTDTDRPRKYWSDLKHKLESEGSEVSEKIGQLKLAAPDGKMRLTDVADTEQVFRLIQSIPSKKAEPFKLWLAQVGQERLNQLQDPERSIEQAIKIVQAYKQAILPLYKDAKVYLYGSYSKGTAHRDSDIDVAVVVPHLQGSWFSVVPPLWKKARSINTLIEPVIMEANEHSPLYDDVMRTGIAI